MEESLQNVYISNHHNVHIKYCTILFVCYTSIKLGGKKKKTYVDQKSKLQRVCTVWYHLYTVYQYAKNIYIHIHIFIYGIHRV